MIFKQTVSRSIPLCFIVLFTCLISNNLIAKTDIKIAVASNFHYTLSELFKDYPQADNVQFKLSSGSSGLLYAQIKQGAPFDLFFSADSLRPQLLEQAELTVLRQTYALGQLVLWSNTALSKGINKSITTQKVTDKTKHEQSYIQVLQNHKGKLAYANPKLAPFGIAAEQVLASLKLEHQTHILGNNANQVFQFIDTNNVTLGFVPLSLLIQAKDKFKKALNKSFRQDKYDHYWVIPNTQYQTIKQQMVVLKSSKHSTKHIKEVQKFVDYILSEDVQKRLVTMGYNSPSSTNNKEANSKGSAK